MAGADLITTLVPHLSAVVIDHVAARGATVHVWARTRSRRVDCPGCGTPSARVHSRYQRTLSDAPVCGRPLVVHLKVRRLRCCHADCPRVTFVEQVQGLTVAHARRSRVLRQALQRVAVALAGRAGARLASRLGMVTSRSSLLRLLRSLPDPPSSGLKVVGVDDFALRRGHVYGTVLINLDTGRPVDLLPDRRAGTLADWLAEHPDIEVVCRDRGGAYADGAARGAPQAIQVADRWHLWHNLGEAVEKTVAFHRHTLSAATIVTHRARADAAADTAAVPAAASPVSQPATTYASQQRRGDRVAERTRARHQQVHQLLYQGHSLRAIAAQLGLSRGTVRRFVRASDPEQLLVANGTGRRARLLDPFLPYLHQRFADGCTNAASLTGEIAARGYRGGGTAVRTYLHHLRGAGSVPQPTPAAPTVRQATCWMMTDPNHLDPDEHHRLRAILDHSGELATLAEHVRGFAAMIRHLTGHRLPAWITSARASGIRPLASFAAGLERDLDAARAGLTLPHNSGPVEGHVNRIKMLKRQMFGRAGLDLLRARVLHYT